MDDDEEYEMRLEHYLEIGAVTIEGVDENGQIIFAIAENAEEIAPELWEAHQDYVNRSLLALYEKGLMEVEYDENLEATFHISPEGKQLAKELGLIDLEDEG